MNNPVIFLNIKPLIDILCRNRFVFFFLKRERGILMEAYKLDGDTNPKKNNNKKKKTQNDYDKECQSTV